MSPSVTSDLWFVFISRTAQTIVFSPALAALPPSGDARLGPQPDCWGFRGRS